MRKNRLRTLILLLCLAFLFTPGDAQEVSSFPKPVEVAMPERGKLEQQITYTGHLAARGTVEIFAGISGKLVSLFVEDGSAVNRGDVLAETDTRELQLGLKQAQTALKAAESQLAITQATAEIKIRSQVEAAEASLSAASAQLAQAEALAEKQVKTAWKQAQAGVRAAEASLEKAIKGARSQEVEQAKAAVSGAKANLANAEANFARVKKLHDTEAISDKDFDAAKAQLDGAKAQHESMLEQLSLVQEGAREEDITAAEAQHYQAQLSYELADAAVNTKDWQHQIAMAASQVKQAEANLKTVRELVTIRAWEHEIAATEAQRDQAAAQVSLAEKRLTDATITAPIAGIVVNRAVDVGDAATAAGSPSAKPICTIVEMNVVYAVFAVPEVDLSNVGVGNTVGIATRDQHINGKISFIAPIVNPEDRSVQVKAEIPNTDYRLKPGMFVEVHIDRTAPEDSLLLPRSAVLDIKEGVGHVFVATDGLARQQSVKVGLAWGENISILEGVTDTTEVIVSGHRKLVDGAGIVVVK